MKQEEAMSAVTIDSTRCKGCELCCRVCPQGVLRVAKQINTKGYFPAEVGDGTLCMGCCMCAVVCPDVAIEVRVHGVHYDFLGQ